MIARHILTFQQAAATGGVERAQLRLAAGWAAAGRRVTIVRGVDDPTGPAGTDLRTLGVTGYPALVRAMPDAVRTLRPDVIFCPGNHYTSTAAWLRWRLGHDCPPVVAKVSNTLIRHHHGVAAAALRRWWLRRHPAFVDHLVAMTPGSAADAMAAMRMPDTRISVIANPPRIGAGGPLPLPDGRFVLGVGRLERQKRWDRLIAALPSLPSDVTLLILGEGSERLALERQAERLGLGRRVSLPGAVDDPGPALRAAGVVALTSDFEGVPGALREALAEGTPVVATASSVAIPEIVSSAALGDIVAPDDAAALVAAISRWLDPATVRPAPVPPPGADAVARYLALFDELVSRRAGRDPDGRRRPAAMP